jgi:hypothetical protein
MSDIITMSEVAEIADPKVKAIAKRVLKELQLEAEKAVAHHAEPTTYPLSNDPDSGEQLFLSRFNQLNQTKRRIAVIKVMDSVKAPDSERKKFYGDLAAVNLRLSTTVEQQARKLTLPASIKFPMSHLISLSQTPGQVLVTHSIEGLTPQQTTDNLELRIHKVKCVDETNPEFWGDDEIALGGVAVDETGDTHKISQFLVGSSFDDGEQKTYSPPKRFTSFNLREGDKFPKTYCVTLALSEKDMGGFADFLNKLWSKVKEKVLALVAAAVGGAIGTAVVPGLGTIVGAAVGWALGKLVDWLIGLFGDDVFKPITVCVNIPSLNARWPGGKTDSPEGVLTYKAFGGTYQLTFDWRLFA